MIIDPYQTTVTRGYKREKLVQAVVAAAMADECRSGIYAITAKDDDEESYPRPSHNMDIPTLSQPLLFTLPSSKDPLIAIDFRPFKGRNSYVKEQIEVLNCKAKLTLHCAIEGSTADLYSTVPQIAYANIVSGLVAYRFGIDVQIKSLLTIVAAAHYYNMTHSFRDKGLYTETEKMMLANSLVKTLRLPAEMIQQTLETMTNGSTIDDLIENMKRIDHTGRTTSLNTGILINGSNELWYGVGYTENVGVAFEHAPTWCAMLAAVLGKGGYSRGEFAKRLKYISVIRDKSESFLNAIRTIELEFE